MALKRASVNYNPTNTLPIDPETGEPFVVETGKGWTLTVQWNGTKTENAYPAPASGVTYGLRKPTIITEDTTVYAKLVSTSEETKLVWGHFVENWEEEGYQGFENLEAAQDYFNI